MNQDPVMSSGTRPGNAKYIVGATVVVVVALVVYFASAAKSPDEVPTPSVNQPAPIVDQPTATSTSSTAPVVPTDAASSTTSAPMETTNPSASAPTKPVAKIAPRGDEGDDEESDDERGSAPTPTSQPAPVTAPAALPPATKGKYKNGTYTAVGNYESPAGTEQVTLTVTLANGVITDSQFQASSQVRRSQHYMDIFSANYKPLVIGKNIADVQLSQVSGSSLTPQGFTDALAKIKAQAAV